jgi:hypothetical protein
MLFSQFVNNSCVLRASVFGVLHLPSNLLYLGTSIAALYTCSFGGRVLTHTFPPPPLPSASELDSAVSARICSHHILEMLCSQHILEMLAAVTNVLLGIPTLEAARLDSLTKT